MRVAYATGELAAGSLTRGVGAYARELLEALRRHYPDDTFVTTSLKFDARNFDLIHIPYFDPFFLTLPSSLPLPTVVTVHDAITLKYPAHFPRGLRGQLKWKLQQRALKRVSHVITDSVASRRDLVSLVGLPEDKLSVVPLAPATDRETSTIEAKVKKTYSLPNRYLLYVGDVNWNKNLPGLISAFGVLADPRLHLVLVGKVFSDAPDIPEFRAVTAAIAACGEAATRIHLLGYIPSHHLPALYRLATLYVQPSFDEGFGLPVLEAMKAQCPVVSSNQGSLPEVGGEAVAYFDPQKDGELAQIIHELLVSPAKRRKLAMAGREQIKQFTWSNTAKLTYAVYEKVLLS